MLKDKGDNEKDLNEECENDSENEKKDKDNENVNESTEDNSEEEVEETEDKEDKEDKEISLLGELKKENSKLKDENKKAINELDSIKDRLARVMAEYDNFRKRTVKEKDNIYSDACKDILKEVLPVLDNLERAVNVEGNAEDLKKGIEMTMKQFNNALSKLNVEEIPCEGEFDPNLHNAVMHIEDDKYDKNSIVEVLQKGYKREDKIIRYSMVKVAN
ncbi:nucleotide exchange factor GrpE [Clostridium autoethanogenum]|jgi:molecular chaperone GrpE|uniref:Protein GrpE n=2 Tax=Clostridium autoethanogenum TaxID=84023 RepID=A0A3M0S665_9CLOT|nr:nucleotide exchange factor GrpE [Clostridium autoethanogenum]AGY77095.1 nucleotide exchange factor GrpE [Clostridium autoethanogenum DSM 10061]ALU37238.1 Heat shock protein grpE [Clostridium autoethanogenum DSM 10061]OVY50194.1 Protein GrpE [Clostridium autoethanogenum]RMC93184.1 nucleotide exchange factor GrpE [Clostridium autoethanogenum]